MSELTKNKNKGSGRAIAGLLILGFGCLLLLNQVGVYFPHWIFGWHTWLILWGIFIGVRNNWKGAGAFIMIGVGVVFMIDDMFPDFDTSAFVWPMIIIGFGLFMIFGRRSKAFKDMMYNRNKKFDWDRRQFQGPGYTAESSETFSNTTEDGPQPDQPNNSGTYYDDFIDSVSIFGGTKKNVYSKSFRGGDIVNFMGGAEINFTQADIKGRVELDVTQIFGGTKIIVPPHWEVQSEMAAIFGSVEDKRHIQQQATSDKVLVIKGTSIFGGIDIRSF
ncbi:hypothetical protein GS399_09055 [Pedobacter sp. HMF7647]|uniref:Cell wall-active antibiotics response LiaF-like C-terminal domain-containing protein n=1 Tax=Hufsiella arboris TaxID=2695275 RepID=A0A7K1Y961_9SPHI|nr:LiaF domain-containing protein [Hufsiella arboris]MXV51115.1 hypothetical protein [Hufsiella arboris]